MKGRKSATPQQAMTSPAGSPPSDNDSGSKEQDRFLPIANVSRIMKRSLPANAKISKEAKETVQECVSEFISFITGEASDKCQREKRKTINGDDLLWAMTTLGFDSYVVPLKTYLGRYRETEGEKNSMARQQERQQMAGGEHDGGRSPSEDGSGVVNPAGVDGGYYSTAAASGIGGAHGLYGRMTGGSQEDRRAALPGHFHGVQW